MLYLLVLFFAPPVVAAGEMSEGLSAGAATSNPAPVSKVKPASSSSKIKSKVRIGDNAIASKLNLKLRDIEKGWFFTLSDFCHPGKGRSYQKKKTVILDFFSTDCKPCIKMLPRLAAFARRHGDSVQVLLIAIPEKNDLDGRRLRSFFARNPVPFPVLEDLTGYHAEKWLPENNGVPVMPCLFLIDKEGRVRAEVPGFHDSIDSALSPALRDALKM